MIAEIMKLQGQCNNRQYLKLVCLDDYVTYINPSDRIERIKGRLMKVHRKNGNIILLHVDKVIVVCLTDVGL